MKQKFCSKCGKACLKKERHSFFSPDTGKRMVAYTFYCPKGWFKDIPIGWGQHSIYNTGYYETQD